MSERQPVMSFVRDKARVARNIKKLTEPRAIAGFCLAEARTYGVITTQFTEDALLEKIMSMVTMRMKKKVTMDDIRQLHFFDDCEDIVFDIRHGDGTIQKALADFDEQDIEQVTQQKTNNIRAAETEAELWERSIKLIIPLLRDNPGWVWRDAVNELAASGLV